MSTPMNLNPIDQQFYNWCQQFCAYVSLTYGVALQPVFVQNPDNGNPYGSGYLYYLVASKPVAPKATNLSIMIDTGYMYGWPNQSAMSQLAPLVLSALAAPYAPPSPLPIAAPVVVTPPPPTDPIGPAFVYDPAKWIDTGATGYSVGVPYTFPATANHPAGAFLKNVSQGLFSVQYWWTVAPPVPSIVEPTAQA